MGVFVYVLECCDVAERKDGSFGGFDRNDATAQRNATFSTTKNTKSAKKKNPDHADRRR
jgi:hypothetical protein